MRALIVAASLAAVWTASVAAASPLLAALAPGARAGATGATATIFAVVLNIGETTQTNCRIGLDEAYSGDAPLVVGFQTASPSNALTGAPDTPVDIPAGGAQNFVVSLTPSAPFEGRDIALRFACDDASAPVLAGVNTIFFSASDAPPPDLVAIAVTPSGDGVMRIGEPAGTGVMAAAAVNIGAPADIVASADTGDYAWPVSLTLCETEPTGACKAPPTAAGLPVSFGPGEVRTFSVFAVADDRLGVPLMPDIARVFLRFAAAGAPAGAASAALAAPESEANFTPLALEAAADWAEADGARALLIMREGATLLERYWGAGGPDVAEVLNSGTKSFGCALAGAARDDGLFNPDDLAWSGIAAWGPGGAAPDNAAKRKIRGHHLQAISHGLPGGFPIGDISGLDSYAQAIGAESRFDPGLVALYGRAGFQAFAAMFELRTGGAYNENGVIAGGLDPADYVRDRVLSPLGMTVSFARDLVGKPDFAAAAATTARDWAKYGRFLLDDGRWEGAQILQPSSVRRCPHFRNRAFLGYGLTFWLNRPVENSYQPLLDSLPAEARVHMPTAGRILPAAPPDLYIAWGAFNMQMHMIPSERLVIVKFGGVGDQNEFFATLFQGAF